MQGEFCFFAGTPLFEGTAYHHQAKTSSLGGINLPDRARYRSRAGYRFPDWSKALLRCLRSRLEWHHEALSPSNGQSSRTRTITSTIRRRGCCKEMLIRLNERFDRGEPPNLPDGAGHRFPG